MPGSREIEIRPLYEASHFDAALALELPKDERRNRALGLSGSEVYPYVWLPPQEQYSYIYTRWSPWERRCLYRSVGG